MPNNSLHTGLNFSKSRAFISDLANLTADKVAATLAYRDFNISLNTEVLLNNESSAQDELIDGLSAFINENTSQKLSFVIDNSLVNSTSVPYSGNLTEEELAELVDNEFSLIVGEKKSFYIYEWAPIKNNKVLIFWIPEIIIARLQLIVSRLGKNLTIVDLEPLSIINLVNEKHILPDDEKLNIIIKFEDDYFSITGYEKSELVFYEIYYKNSPVDCPFHIIKLLKMHQIELKNLQKIYWYGKELPQSLTNLQSVLNKPAESLFESLKILFHRHSECGNLLLDSSVPSLSVALRNES